MADVFLSYSSADRAKAVAMERALSGAGYEVFWDQETPAGVDWDDWIRQKLKLAKVVVVLWSKTSIASPNVRHEAMIARDGGLLVPVLIEPLKPTDFPMGLYLVQALLLDRWNGAQDDPQLHRVLSEVAVRMKRPAPAPPKPRKKSMAPMLIGALAVIGVLGAGGYYMLSQQRAVADDTATATTAQNASAFARSLVGRWRLLRSADCSAAFQVRAEAGSFALVGPDGTSQNETVDSMSDGWLRTFGAGGTPSYYKLEGQVLLYRYGDVTNATDQTEFQRCG